MEGAAAIAAIVPANTANAVVATTTQSNNKNNHDKAKKKRGALHLVRVALFMLRRKSNGKSKSSMHVDVASKGMWKRLLGSMRPLHLQDNQSPPPPSSTTGAALSTVITIEHFDDVLQSPVSPLGPYSDSSASSSCDDTSRYASAVNLQELDKSEGCDEEIVFDDLGGDLMIDAKAEMFIAQFYEQMKLQRLDSINRYNEMIARAIR